MPPAADLAALFIRYAAEGRDPAWLADGLLAVAARSRRVHLTRAPDAADGLYCRVDTADGTAEVVAPDHRPFRLLLLHLARAHSAAWGREPLPAGGRLAFVRPTPDGDVRVDGVFANSADVQHLTLTARAAGGGGGR